MDKYEAVGRVLAIRNEMYELINEARGIAKEFLGNDIHGYDAYVFEQIKEHLEKGNRYNQDLQDVANAIENSDQDEQDDSDDEDLTDEEYVRSRKIKA